MFTEPGERVVEGEDDLTHGDRSRAFRVRSNVTVPRARPEALDRRHFLARLQLQLEHRGRRERRLLRLRASSDADYHQRDRTDKRRARWE